MSKQLPPHIIVMGAIFDTLPTPEKDGIKITIVGHGFGGDLISKGDTWEVTGGFSVSTKFPPPKN